MRKRKVKRLQFVSYSSWFVSLFVFFFFCFFLSSSSFDDKDTYEVPVMVNATTLVIMLLCSYVSLMFYNIFYDCMWCYKYRLRKRSALKLYEFFFSFCYFTLVAIFKFQCTNKKKLVQLLIKQPHFYIFTCH